MVFKLPCLRHKIADQIKQDHFNKMYNTMHSLVSKRNAILHVSFLKKQDKFDFVQHYNRRDHLNRFIINNQYMVLTNFYVNSQ